MNKRLRTFGITVFFILSFALAASQEGFAQTTQSVSTADGLYQAMLDGDIRTITLTGAIAIEGAAEPFVLEGDDGMIKRAVEIVTNGHKIAYNNRAEDDTTEFYIEIDASGSLKFTGAADISGAYSSDYALFGLRGGTLTFDGAVKLSNNESGSDGGAVIVYYGEDGEIPVLTFNGTAEISGNTAGGSGGAIYMLGDYEDAVATLNATGGNVTFSNNTSGSDGGAISATWSELNFGQTLAFNNNTSGGNGGAVNMWDSALNVEGQLELRGNTAASSGGALYTYAIDSPTGIAIKKGITASGNKALGGEGGVAYLDATTMVVGVDGSESRFTGNSAADGSYGGGAFYLCDTSTLRFDGAAYFGTKGTSNSGNTAISGGAFYIDTTDGENDYALVFNKAAGFYYNEATDGDGGALFVDSSRVSFNDNVEFGNNTSTGEYYGGGAIYATGADAAIRFHGADKTITFDANSAKMPTGIDYEGSGGKGGAIFVNGLGSTIISDPTVDYGWTVEGNAVFKSNSAMEGGAIFADNSSMHFNTAEFTTNSAGFRETEESGPGGGGAIRADMSLIVFDGKATFDGNLATNARGGALYAVASGEPETDPLSYGVQFNAGAVFQNNKASSGGAMYLDRSAVSFSGETNITGNSATSSGGAIYLDGSTVSFSGVTTISGNSATTSGGAVHVNYDSLLDFRSGSTTTISANSAGRGGAIYVGNGSTLTLKLEAGASSNQQTTLQIDAASGSAKNDIYIDSASTLSLLTEANSTLTIASAITSADDDTYMIKSGDGAVYITGDASGFIGSLTIEKGDLYIGAAGTIGSVDSTVLTIEDEGALILTVGAGAGSSKERIFLSQMDLSPGSEPKIVAKALNDSISADDKFAFIRLQDEDGSILQGYVDDGLIGSYYSFLTFDPTITTNSDGTSTLSISLTYDSTNHDWTFDMPDADDEFTLNTKLDNTTAGNTGKKLTVNGAGVLKLNNDDLVNALEGTGNLEILTGKSLTVNGSSDATFSGNIAGAGAFIKDGSFTQTLSGDNTYAGGTTVKNGSLAGNTQSLQGSIAIEQSGSVVFDQGTLTSGKGNFAGTFTGAGNLTIKGKDANGGFDVGGVTLTGDSNTFAGQTTVESGWLIFDSTQTAASLGGSSLMVGAKGGLGGFGTISAPVTIQTGGILQASGGDLHLRSNLEFKQGGVVYVYVNGTQTNVIDVAGNVKLDGTTVKIVGVDDSYVENTSFTFLKSGDTIDGSFANADGKAKYTSGETEWTFSLAKSSDSTTYDMSGTKGDSPPPPPPPTPTGLGWNQTRVTVALNAIDGAAGVKTGFQAMIDDLKTHVKYEDGKVVGYDDIYRDATKQLAGSVRANGLQLGLYSPWRTVFNRLSLGSELYGGAPTIYNNGYGPIEGMEYQGADESDTFRGQANCYSGYSGYAVPCMMGENNFWADVVHVQTKTRADANSDAYGISRTGFLVGLDVQKAQTSRVGVLFGYFAPYLWQRNDRVDADDYHGGLYFQKNYMGTELYGYLGYAHQEYDSTRYVDLSSLGTGYDRERYTGGTSGDSFSFSIEASKPRYYGCDYVLRPLIGLDYLYTSQKGYAETGSGSGLYALRYDRANYDQWFVRLGLNFKKETFRYSTVLRAQYINQFADKPYPDGNARFAAVGIATPGMNVRGVDLGRDYVNLGFGLNLFINSARSKLLSFDYDANMSKRTTQHGLSLIYVERY